MVKRVSVVLAREPVLSALSPVPVTCVTSFDYNDPENTSDTRYLLGYEVGGSRDLSWPGGELSTHPPQVIWRTFVSPLGSQFGGYRTDLRCG